jgi:dTDP-4-dehydrorhamnose 3,5-epimerase
MKITDTEIPDVKLLEPKVFEDDRGFFFESWRADGLNECSDADRWVQDNHSRSARNVLRGLHYQIEQPQGKLVRAIRGAIFDVAVDLRRSSPSFGQWVGRTLSEDNKQILWIPPGFAHGFLALTDEAEVLYKCTEYYAPEHERTIAWNDPDIAIGWPLDKGTHPLVSAKDAKGALLSKADLFA